MKTTFCFIGMERDLQYLETDCREFEFLVQRGVLLALKDAALLSEAQHRLAENMLYKEHNKVLHLT